MARFTPASSRAFAALGCVDSLVGLLASTERELRVQAALSLERLLALDEEDDSEEEEDDGALGGDLTQIAIDLGAIGFLLDMVTSGVTSLMQAAGYSSGAVGGGGNGGCLFVLLSYDAIFRCLPPNVSPRNNSLNRFMSPTHPPPHGPASVQPSLPNIDTAFMH